METLLLAHYLPAALLLAGLYLVLTRRNAVGALLGVELIFNAATLAFVGANLRHPNNLDGQTAALITLVLAAVDAAVALALLINVYRRYRTVNLDELTVLKDD